METPLKEHEAARILGTSPFTLRAWRRQGRGPAFMKFGKAVRYRRADVAAYKAAVDAQTRVAEVATEIREATGVFEPDLLLPANDPRSYEAAIRDQLTAEGWQVVRHGWPDYLAIHPDGRVKAIEVKGGKDRLKPHQARVHEALRRAGLQVDVVRVAKHENCSVDCSVTTSKPEEIGRGRKVA